MKSKIIFAFLLIGMLSYFLISAPRTVSTVEYDLNGDGQIETVEIIKQGQKYYFRISCVDELVYEKDIAYLSPESVEICEIDGDGVPEIFMVVNKSTEYFDEVASRPFFFNFVGGELYQKWTGSKFGAEFEQVYFFDLYNDGIDEIITVNLHENGKNVSISRWNGFGFDFLGESELFEDVYSVEIGEDDVLTVDVRRDGKNVKLSMRLGVEDGKANFFEIGD